jgi:hypothetical protein
MIKNGSLSYQTSSTALGMPLIFQFSHQIFNRNGWGFSYSPQMSNEHIKCFDERTRYDDKNVNSTLQLKCIM